MKNRLNKAKIAVVVVILTTLLIPQVTHAAFRDVLTAFTTGSKTVASALENALSTTTDEVLVEDKVSFPVSLERDPVRTLTVIATSYSSDPNQTDDTPCLPAMWKYDLCEQFLKHGEENTIAANFLLLGTQVRFPELYGDKIFTVRDRMNSRYNYDRIGYYRIDFYKAELGENGDVDVKASKQEARQFGIKRGLKMEILAYVK